jgi:glycosyltransferase involved in cell wall biosynthesis
MPAVVLVHLGRERAMGEQRRIESWARLFAACGAEVHTLALIAATRRRLPAPGDLWRVATARLAPEALAWSSRAALDALRKRKPRLVVCVTTRAFHPTFLDVAPVVLDYVDSLAGSYQQRSSLATSPPAALAFAALSRLHARVERPGSLDVSRRVAAGVSDARLLDAEWFPIVASDFRQVRPESSDHDFVFIGNLAYLPNIAALNFLASVWPEVQRQRPGTTLLVAGRRPPRPVAEVIDGHGWTLQADFADVFDVLGRGRVALVPVEHLSGISTKVLDAAAMGVPQVVTPAALSGVAEGFPAVVAESKDDFVSAALSLLEDEPRRRGLADAGRDLMLRSYSVEAWKPMVEELLRTPA